MLEHFIQGSSRVVLNSQKKKKRKVERKIVGFFVYRRLKLKYFDEDRKNYRINYYSSI